MKSLLRGIVVSILTALTKRILAKYTPKIVMVTGSVGKTSTKDAIAAALSGSIYLRKSEKSYNSEFGLPLTVIGAKTAWGSVTGWLSIIVEGFAVLLLPTHYPKLLVLEVGADKPKDLKKILRIATPDVVVVTRLPEVPVHVEAYEGPSQVREEEFAPACALSEGAPLILSSEDEYAKTMAVTTRGAVTTYGYASDADVSISGAAFTEKGMQATLTLSGKTFEVTAPGVIGMQHLYAPAAAVAVATALNLPLKQVLTSLATYEPPPGRSRVLQGVKDTLLIDDTYNSSPAAVEEALKSLALIPERRKVVILGDMLELGRYSNEEHERIGVLAAEYADVLITVGQRAQAIATAFLNTGRDEGTVEGFETSTLAAQAIPQTIKERDVVLIKGSQGMRMERITEALLRNADDVEKLPRQDAEWKKR